MCLNCGPTFGCVKGCPTNPEGRESSDAEKRLFKPKADAVDHPDHYGGGDNLYEVIKVIEAWNLGFNLGNTLKYIGRPAKGQYLQDLKKARWYLDREIANLEPKTKPPPAFGISEWPPDGTHKIDLAGNYTVTTDSGITWIRPPGCEKWYRAR